MSELTRTEFDLDAAKRGEPIITRDGRKAKFVAHEPEAIENNQVIFLIEGCVYVRGVDGISAYPAYSKNDIFMAPPPMRSINGIEFPEPLSLPPKKGRSYWLVDLTHPAGIRMATWSGEPCELLLLERGLIQLTRDRANSQAKAMIAAFGREV